MAIRNLLEPKNKKILMIGPYPIIKPHHGGQKRAKAIFEFYNNISLETKYVGVFYGVNYPEWDEGDLPLSDASIISQINLEAHTIELIVGSAINTNVHARSSMAKLLMDYEPDIIHIEQPFAYLGLEPLLAELGLTPCIIFGSQNIEYLLKDRICRESGVPVKARQSLVSRTKELECELSRKADLVVAVNAEDAETHKEMGAKKVVIATNGIDKVKAGPKEVNYWCNYKQNEGIDTILTFVGSGHPPNWEGFLRMIGNDTSFLPQGAKILIVGEVADYFRQKFSDKKLHAKFWNNVSLVGRLEEEKLAALLGLTDVFLLPITTERGSNLKTAEAILSGKKFVATDNTFHGFEKYRNLPNIFVGNTKEEFRKAILNSLDYEYIIPSIKERKLAEKVQWRYSLRPIGLAIARLYIIKSIKNFARLPLIYILPLRKVVGKIRKALKKFQ